MLLPLFCLLVPWSHLINDPTASRSARTVVLINVPTVGQPAGTVVPFEHNAAHITLPAYTHRQINEYGSTPHLQAGSE
jgi:hypothetical protein